MLTSNNITARAEAGDIIFEGSLVNISPSMYMHIIGTYSFPQLDPVCTCEVTLLVGGATGTTSCTPGTGSTITFPVTDFFFNQLLSVIVTLRNGRLSMVSQIEISMLLYYHYLLN